MDNPTGGDSGTPTKKSKSQPAKYKQMVAKPDTSTLITEHSDGKIGPWGNPIKQGTPQPPQAQSPAIKISDKAAGLSNNYYPANGMPTSPAIPTKKRSQ